MGSGFFMSCERVSKLWNMMDLNSSWVVSVISRVSRSSSARKSGSRRHRRRVASLMPASFAARVRLGETASIGSARICLRVSSGPDSSCARFLAQWSNRSHGRWACLLVRSWYLWGGCRVLAGLFRRKRKRRAVFGSPSLVSFSGSLGPTSPPRPQASLFALSYWCPETLSLWAEAPLPFGVLLLGVGSGQGFCCWAGGSYGVAWECESPDVLGSCDVPFSMLGDADGERSAHLRAFVGMVWPTGRLCWFYGSGLGEFAEGPTAIVVGDFLWGMLVLKGAA